MIPLSFAWAFQYDMCYGDKQLRVQKNAADLLTDERFRLRLPFPNPLCTEVDYD
eukprot:Pgem_evm1s15296